MTTRALAFDACKRQAPKSLAARITSGVRSCGAQSLSGPARDAEDGASSFIVRVESADAAVSILSESDGEEDASTSAEVSDVDVAALTDGLAFCAACSKDA